MFLGKFVVADQVPQVGGYSVIRVPSYSARAGQGELRVNVPRLSFPGKPSTRLLGYGTPPKCHASVLRSLTGSKVFTYSTLCATSTAEQPRLSIRRFILVCLLQSATCGNRSRYNSLSTPAPLHVARSVWYEHCSHRLTAQWEPRPACLQNHPRPLLLPPILRLVQFVLFLYAEADNRLQTQFHHPLREDCTAIASTIDDLNHSLQPRPSWGLNPI